MSDQIKRAIVTKEILGSSNNLIDTSSLEEPAFLDNDGPSTEIPIFITVTNARELFDLRPEETVSQAIIRYNSKNITPST